MVGPVSRHTSATFRLGVLAFCIFASSIWSADSAELLAEEFRCVSAGSNLGWPYTYFPKEKG